MKNILAKYYIILPLLISFILVSCTTVPDKRISREYLDYLNDSIGVYNHNIDYYTPESYFIDGATYEQQGLYSEAIVEYLEALRQDTNAVIYYALGKNYMKLYKFDRAEEYYKLAVNMDSTFLPALHGLGDVYLLQYNREEAEKTFEEIVRINPEPKNLYRLAYLYEFSSQEKAVELYEKLRLSNEDYLILTKLADLYLELQDTVKYVDRLEKAHTYAKDNPETISRLVSAYLSRGYYSKASNLLKETDIRLVSEDLEYLYLDIGSDLFEISDTNSNQFKNQWLALIDSRFYFNWQLQSIAGFISAQVDDTLKSEKHFNRAMSAADSIPEISLQLANYYIFFDNPDKAFEILEEYKKKFPKDYRFPNLMGIAYFSVNNYMNSIVQFEESLVLNKDNLDACTQLGIIYDQLGKVDSSDFYYESALRIDPYDALTNNNYAYSLSLRGKDLDRALEMSSISLDIDSDNASYLDTYGWILFKMERYNEALEYILKASEIDGVTAEVFEHLGDVYFRLNEYQKAEDVWKKGLELEPERDSILRRLEKNNK